MGKINRRSALAVTGAGLTAALVSTARSLAAPADPSLAKLEALIARHAEAYKHDDVLWTRAATLDDEISDRRPKVRVQVGRLLGPRDDDGNDTWTPIWSSSAKKIDERCDRETETLVRFHAFGPDAAERERIIREKRRAWAEGKKAELASLEAEVKRIDDESGYTEVLEAAQASTEVVKGIEAEIINFKPATLAAAARQAGWVLAAYREDVSAYIGVEEQLEATLASISSAWGEAA